MARRSSLLLAYYHTGLAIARNIASPSGTAVLAAAATLTTNWVHTRLDPMNANATAKMAPHDQALFIVGFVTADQASAAFPNGLILDISNDYATTKTGVVSYGLGNIPAANDILRIAERIDGLFVRLRYVNGAVAQTSMQLDATLQERR